jgi:hypothetical protein
MARILIGDTIYEINAAYRAGARAMRDNVTYKACPHRDGSYACDQWQSGHCHEADGEHFRFGCDVLATRRPTDFLWQEDPDVPRRSDGTIDACWYARHIPGQRNGTSAPSRTLTCPA